MTETTKATVRILGANTVYEALRNGVALTDIVDAAMRVAFQHNLKGLHVETLRKAVASVDDGVDLETELYELENADTQVTAVPEPIYSDGSSRIL